VGTVRIDWQGGERYDALDSKGMPVDIDGDQALGAKPSDLLPISLAACAAVDVVEQLAAGPGTLVGLAIEVRFLQELEPPWRFQRFHLRYLVEGRGLDPGVVERAVRHSEQERCSVAATLRGCVALESSVVVREAPPEAVPPPARAAGEGPAGHGV